MQFEHTAIVQTPSEAPIVDEETFPALVRPGRAGRRGSRVDGRMHSAWPRLLHRIGIVET